MRLSILPVLVAVTAVTGCTDAGPAIEGRWAITGGAGACKQADGDPIVGINVVVHPPLLPDEPVLESRYDCSDGGFFEAVDAGEYWVRIEAFATEEVTGIFQFADGIGSAGLVRVVDIPVDVGVIQVAVD